MIGTIVFWLALVIGLIAAGIFRVAIVTHRGRNPDSEFPLKLKTRILLWLCILFSCCVALWKLLQMTKAL